MKFDLTPHQEATCNGYGFSFQILTVGGTEIGCVGEYQELSEDYAAVFSCELFECEEFPWMECPIACFKDWSLLSLVNGELTHLDMPYFDHLYSSPSFWEQYVSYWGLSRDDPGNPALDLYAMVFNWRTKTEIHRELIGTREIATDNPGHFGSPYSSKIITRKTR